MTLTQNPQTATADEFAERVFEAALGALDTWSMFVGDKLGWYRLLADRPLTVFELASQSGTDPRYANEWLEQQATTGILVVDDARLPQDLRRYSLPAGHSEVLTDTDSLAYLAPFVRLLTAGGIKLPEIVDVYRNGGGVSWADFGPDMRTGQAEMNRPWFLNQLSSEWLSKVPELEARLSAGARVADIGCGEGWSSVGIAQSYPGVVVDVDGMSHEPSVGTGTVMRPSVLEGYARRAGFDSIDVLPIENDLWRFYRLNFG